VNIKGKGGIDGDGDVTKPENLKEFQKFVVDQTNHRGVHFMMADGVSRSQNLIGKVVFLLLICFF
jgi:cap1 methyltransferase